MAVVLLLGLAISFPAAGASTLDPNWGLKTGTATFEELSAATLTFNAEIYQGSKFEIIDGTLWVSGRDRYGEFGLPDAATPATITTPRYVPAFYNPDNKDLPKAVQVLGGYASVLASDGKIYTAQKCTDGRVGYEYLPAPFYATDPTRLTAVRLLS